MKNIFYLSTALCIILVTGCGGWSTTGTPTPSLDDSRTRPPDGAELLYSPEPPASAQNPCFSPDGDSLLFTLFHEGYNDGPAGVYLLPLENRAPAVLLDEANQDAVNLPGSCWNDPTGHIVFASDREDADRIWMMDVDGSGLFRVTGGDAGYHIEPSFSPDGEWIVFEAGEDVPDDRQRGSIWKVRADGNGLTRLTRDSDDRQPNWSPRGDLILFQRRTPGGGDWNLYVMQPDGSDIYPVTDTPSEDTDASWSPDGRWVVYSSDYGGLSAPNIFAMSVYGGKPVRVTNGDVREDGAPSWSPDGKWIVFESHPDEDAPASLWRIQAPDDSLAGGRD